jgi:hypothetical protein
VDIGLRTEADAEKMKLKMGKILVLEALKDPESSLAKDEDVINCEKPEDLTDWELIILDEKECYLNVKAAGEMTNNGVIDPKHVNPQLENPGGGSISLTEIEGLPEGSQPVLTGVLPDGSKKPINAGDLEVLRKEDYPTFVQTCVMEDEYNSLPEDQKNKYVPIVVDGETVYWPTEAEMGQKFADAQAEEGAAQPNAPNADKAAAAELPPEDEGPQEEEPVLDPTPEVKPEVIVGVPVPDPKCPEQADVEIKDTGMVDVMVGDQKAGKFPSREVAPLSVCASKDAKLSADTVFDGVTFDKLELQKSGNNYEILNFEELVINIDAAALEKSKLVFETLDTQHYDLIKLFENSADPVTLKPQPIKLTFKELTISDLPIENWEFKNPKAKTLTIDGTASQEAPTSIKLKSGTAKLVLQNAWTTLPNPEIADPALIYNEEYVSQLQIEPAIPTILGDNGYAPTYTFNSKEVKGLKFSNIVFDKNVLEGFGENVLYNDVQVEAQSVFGVEEEQPKRVLMRAEKDGFKVHLRKEKFVGAFCVKRGLFKLARSGSSGCE